MSRLTPHFPWFRLSPMGGGVGGVGGSGTSNELAYWVDSSNLGTLAVATYPSLTELSYVKGVTSAIQTQLGTKAPSTSPTFATSITGSYLTASEILITDGSKNIVSAAVATYPSLTELTYLKGVTSAIQTQLNAKGTLSNVSEDTTPQLGGNLDVNGQSIVSVSDGHIVFAPNGTGIVKGELKRFMVRLEEATTSLATATTKGGDYRISNRAITVKAVGAYVDTAAATGSNLLTIDIHEAGTTIMTTNKITIDVGEKTSESATTAPAVTDTAIAADAIITFDIDQVNETTPAKGLVCWIDYIYA